MPWSNCLVQSNHRSGSKRFQGEPRNHGNNGYQELSLTSAQRQACIYCKRTGILSFWGLTTALIVSVIVVWSFNQMPNNALVKNCLVQSNHRSGSKRFQGEPRNHGNNGYQELSLTSAQRQACIYFNRTNILFVLGAYNCTYCKCNYGVEFQPNAQQFLGQKLFGTIKSQVWI